MVMNMMMIHTVETPYKFAFQLMQADIETYMVVAQIEYISKYFMLAFIHGLPEHLPTMGVLNNHPQNIFSLAPIQVVWKSTN